MKRWRFETFKSPPRDIRPRWFTVARGSIWVHHPEVHNLLTLDTGLLRILDCAATSTVKHDLAEPERLGHCTVKMSITAIPLKKFMLI